MDILNIIMNSFITQEKSWLTSGRAGQVYSGAGKGEQEPKRRQSQLTQEWECLPPVWRPCWFHL